MNTMMSEGERSWGKLTAQKDLQAEAPSICAASLSSGGIA